mgnify:CR=1 FL=1
MTETARVVFNELSVTYPATVGEIAQNTYLSRERCQLILTQLVMAGLADYQFGATRGGEVTKFEDFDMDFNRYKYMLETRLSGALTQVYSAIALEEPAA